MSRSLLSALLVLSLFVAPAAAQGPERDLAAQLTSRGRILASGRVLGIWSNDTAAYFGGYNTWTIRVDPALTYFVRDNLGVGVAASVGWSKASLFPHGDYTARDFALGFEFVWSAAIAPRWRLLIRPFVGYGRQAARWTAVELTGGVGSTLIADVESATNYLRFSASLPFVYALTDGIALGIGPDLLFDFLFSRSNEARDRGGFNFAQSTSLPSTTRAQLGLSVAFYASF